MPCPPIPPPGGRCKNEFCTPGMPPPIPPPMPGIMPRPMPGIPPIIPPPIPPPIMPRPIPSPENRGIIISPIYICLRQRLTGVCVPSGSMITQRPKSASCCTISYGQHFVDPSSLNRHPRAGTGSSAFLGRGIGAKVTSYTNTPQHPTIVL
jgi:hypothetical protein